MTSISSKSGLQPQGQSAANQAVSSHSPSPSLSGVSPAPASSQPSSQSYASATKKSATDSSAAPVTVGGSVHHGESTSVSSVSGKPIQQPQSSGVTIVNGGPALPSSNHHPIEHSRKPSVTITSAGTSGYIPNGGSASRPNSLQFGFASQASPSMGTPAALVNQSQPGLGVSPTANPRVTSPQTSPAPIPQPASSGGRPPPSSYQSQGNVPNFGSFGDIGDANMRPAQLGHGPQATHLRRESSQSAHGDLNNHMGNTGPARGGYHSSGRGRGYSQSGYQAQMPYPGPNFRSNPSQHRGGPNVGPQFPGHSPGRPLAPFPNSPHQANRSPALASAHPATPQMGQVPMAPPQMAPQSYSYGQHMGHQPTYPHAYENNYSLYAPSYGMQHMQYMAPPSPQSRHGIPYNMNQAPYIQNQYPVQQAAPPQAAPMSRNASQMSSDHPGSSVGQGQPPSGTPTLSHAHTVSRPSNSPVPPKPNFVIPSTKKNPIVIKDPGSGAVKSFEKTSASPARGAPSPAKAVTPAETPPPQPVSTPDRARSDSKTIKANEEKKQALKDAVRMKIEQDEAEQRRKAEEAARKPKEEKAIEKEAEKEVDKAVGETEGEVAVQKKDTEKEIATQGDVKDLGVEGKVDSVKLATEEPKEDVKPTPAAGDDDDIDYDAIERELAEIEAKQAAAETDYYAKKQAEAEEKKRREEESEAELRKTEEEAEALEKARAEKRETTDEDKDLFASLKKSFLGPSAERPAPDSGATTPASEGSMGPPQFKPSAAAKREKPAALKLETSKAVEPPQPSAALKSLRAARFVDDLSKISYPDSIMSPDPSLNVNAPPDRRFHYSKDFLLQFQNVFKERPSVDWDSRVRETVGESDSSRQQSARTPMAGGRSHVRTDAAPMGHFTTSNIRHGLPPGAAPDQRFSVSSQSRTAMSSSFLMGRPNLGMAAPSISRNSSAGTMFPPMSPRVGSSRGTRTSSKRDKQSARKEEDAAKAMPLTAGKEIKGLQLSATGWKPRSIMQAAAGPTPGSTGYMPPDMVQRKVKAALNKMTPENFERISHQILEIVSQSKDESDGRTLRQVIQLTFEKATDEAHWAPIYAKFCKRMLESMSMEIRDENIRDKSGNVVAGGSLFRKYLLNRCQEEFERGWKINLPPKAEGQTEEAAMMSDEYYAAAAAKRRGLGLVKFIGELYKLGMLTERIMYECVKKLVDYKGMPDEAEVESLTSLLRTIGSSLDASERGHTMMDAYFARINMMMETAGLPSRLKFMLMDIIDLRNSNWVSKDQDKGPKTIQEIREEAALSIQEAEMEKIRQQASRGGGGGRPAMGRGDARNFSGGYSSQQPPTDFASSKVGSDDLRRLRANRNTNQPISFGPSSMLASRSNSGRRNLGPGGNLVRGSDDSAASSRTGTPPAGKREDKDTSSLNSFSALARLEDPDQVAGSPPSNHASPALAKAQPAQLNADRRPSKSESVDAEEAS